MLGVPLPLAFPLFPRRFCSAEEDSAPFGADGVWLPLAVADVSVTLRFLPFETPFAAPVPFVVDAEAGADDDEDAGAGVAADADGVADADAAAGDAAGADGWL